MNNFCYTRSVINFQNVNVYTYNSRAWETGIKNNLFVHGRISGTGKILRLDKHFVFDVDFWRQYFIN